MVIHLSWKKFSSSKPCKPNGSKVPSCSNMEADGWTVCLSDSRHQHKSAQRHYSIIEWGVSINSMERNSKCLARLEQILAKPTKRANSQVGKQSMLMEQPLWTVSDQKVCWIVSNFPLIVLITWCWSNRLHDAAIGLVRWEYSISVITLVIIRYIS